MKNAKRVVIKIGTKCLTGSDRALDMACVRQVADQVASVQEAGARVILVSSGAIGAGLSLLGLKKRPSGLHDLQAVAAIGQGHLMHLYGEYFKARGHLVGQILLTQDDFDSRKRYLNIRHTVDALLAHKTIPIINENDSVATDEIRCGDNDRLSSLVADLCGASRLVLVTDVEGLLGRDGAVIPVVERITPEVLRLAGGSRCDLGTGGMVTKLEAARTVNRSGIECVIVNGRKKDAILKGALGLEAGTVFRGEKASLLARKRWIAFSSKAKGVIIVDDGACEALGKKAKSLLASGITAVEGRFAEGDVVTVVDSAGLPLAKGVTNYSSVELAKIKGRHTGDFKEILGRVSPAEVVHRDNLVIL